jgi:hypothetical protein
MRGIKFNPGDLVVVDPSEFTGFSQHDLSLDTVLSVDRVNSEDIIFFKEKIYSGRWFAYRFKLFENKHRTDIAEYTQLFL